MDTQTFLAALKPYSERPLIFDLGDVHIPGGYHVTEIKAVSTQAMDCGGQADAWRETVVQLWVPDRLEKRSMNVGKFLEIYGRVTAHIHIEAEAELRVEYGALGAPAVSYLVGGVEVSEKVVVRLEPPTVACKAAERSLSDSMNITVLNTSSSCCAPPAKNSAEEGSCCG